MEQTKLLLEEIYPPELGWEYYEQKQEGEIPLAYLLRNRQFCVVVCKMPPEPFVTRKNMAAALELKKRFANRGNATYIKVVLVYGNLLLRPQNVPTDIEIVCVPQEIHEPLNDMIYDYCQN